MHLFDQNYKSQLNLILFFSQVLPLAYVDSPQIKQEKRQTLQKW